MQIRALLLIQALLLLFFASNVFAQTNAQYLKSLAGEASGMSIDEETRSTKPQPVLPSEKRERLGGGVITELTPGLTVDEFEETLKSNYIGSYLFYNRLPAGQKEEIYRFYQSNPDSQKLRDKILQSAKK